MGKARPGLSILEPSRARPMWEACRFEVFTLGHFDRLHAYPTESLHPCPSGVPMFPATFPQPWRIGGRGNAPHPKGQLTQQS